MMSWLERRRRNVSVFLETERIVNDGYYYVDGKRVDLKLSKQQMQECEVYLPGSVFDLKYECDETKFGCHNKDSYDLALEMGEGVLVLNLADPFVAGGLVRQGSNAQEETLCRKSTLLTSLESKAAETYYGYNDGKDGYSSDATIISRNVEVFRGEDYKLLDETRFVSVITIPAPIVSSKDECGNQRYKKVMFQRIYTMLSVAAHCGYKRLVLGAFGCGAFNNDAKVVAEIFKNVLDQINYKDGKCLFSDVEFAVLCYIDDYNYKCFSEVFGNK